RLGTGFLGGEALGIGSRPLLAALGFPYFDRGEDALDETFAVTLQRLLDAADVDEVAADADDHAGMAPSTSARASSISRRMMAMLSARPMKIASPIRKWPMLSSAISGMRAIGLTVSKDRPCPAWTSMPRLRP